MAKRSKYRADQWPDLTLKSVPARKERKGMSNAERQAKYRRKRKLEAQAQRKFVAHLAHRVQKLERAQVEELLGQTDKSKAPPDAAEIETLIKVLNLLGSEVPGERASAALKVDELRQRIGFSWEGLFARAATFKR